jgi:hypothetical protein
MTLKRLHAVHILFIIVAFVLLYLWFNHGEIFSPAARSDESPFASSTTSTENRSSGTESSSPQDAPGASTQTGTTESTGGYTLTPAQAQMLSSFGIDPKTITVTQSMIACAREKLGQERFAEITAGATPTFLEGAALFACYSS